ncbi:interleukin-6 [Leptodactylus fuscus]|uniref:interleukin-6 n=1 Tax=Leptodactylus fuscus TaxID=238119 RepID=UPI003F4E5EE5
MVILKMLQISTAQADYTPSDGFSPRILNKYNLRGHGDHSFRSNSSRGSSTQVWKEKKSAREMESTSCTSLACLLVYLAINAMLPAVWSAPISTKQPTSGQTKGDLEHVANVLYKEADKLCSEMCKIPNLCSSSIEHFLRADLELPEIKHSKSGCLSTNFNKEKCLPKIYSDLLRFQTYLEFLKEAMPSNKDILEFIQYRSTELANKVKDLEEIPSDSKEDTSGITVADLRSKDPWKQIQTSYIILQSFTEYMQKTARAVRNSVKVSK